MTPAVGGAPRDPGAGGRQTRMLVAVRPAAEAEAAIAVGADRLVLTAAGATELRQIAARARGHCPVSLWVDDAAAASRTLREASGADEVYGPAAGGAEPVAGTRCFATVRAGEGTEQRLAGLARAGFAGVALGVDETPQRLLQLVPPGELQRQIEAARACGLSVVIAGPLEPPDIPRLLALAPDAILLGGAVRRGGRDGGTLDPARLALFRELMSRQPDIRATDIETLGRDLILVRDWTVTVHVGAYSHERAAQRVRFTVEAEIAPRPGRAADLRDVVSYDIITDAIARATASHVDLVETLAADVARAVLGHPRVLAVDITVEKLDIGPGRVGCRLRRARRVEA